MILPYVDTDFLLAMLKPSDWLKDDAARLLKKHRGDLWCSPASIAEVLLVCKEFRLDSREVIISLYELVHVEALPRETALAAAHFIETMNVRVFDALHGACAMSDEIISSDSVFDKMGVKRIKLG